MSCEEIAAAVEVVKNWKQFLYKTINRADKGHFEIFEK